MLAPGKSFPLRLMFGLISMAANVSPVRRSCVLMKTCVTKSAVTGGSDGPQPRAVAIRRARSFFAIWLLRGMIAALLMTGCGMSSDVSTPISTGSTAPSGRSQLYRVPSGSMEPTLPIGARVVVKEGGPTVGAIVVFHPPEGAEQQECGPKSYALRPGGAACDAPIPKEDTGVSFIKRVVAGPGDEIYVQDGYVYRKADGSGEFVREQDSHVRACGSSPECNFPVSIKIPARHWFMMGDNRGESDDSRFYGPVPTAWVVGVATDRVLRPPYMSTTR